MRLIHSEFISDIDRANKLLELFLAIKKFGGVQHQDNSLQENFYDESVILQTKIKEAHTDIVIVSGTLILYLAGRFEDFVKTIFEELCSRIASRCCNYKNLPKEMKENLIFQTAEVMLRPERYGYRDIGTHAVIKTLAENLKDQQLSSINNKCLSITNENMRSDIIVDLFKRVGAKNFWEQIGKQANIKVYYESQDEAAIVKNIRSELDEFMKLRNKLAHPSKDVEFPDEGIVKKYIRFFHALSESIVDVSSIYEATLGEKPKETDKEES